MEIRLKSFSSSLTGERYVRIISPKSLMKYPHHRIQVDHAQPLVLAVEQYVADLGIMMRYPYPETRMGPDTLILCQDMPELTDHTDLFFRFPYPGGISPDQGSLELLVPEGEIMKVRQRDMKATGRKAGKQFREFAELPGSLECQLTGFCHIVGMRGSHKGDQPEIPVVRIMDQAPAIRGAQRLDEQIFRKMLVQVVRQCIDIFRNKLRLSEHFLIDMLENIFTPLTAYLPGMIDKAGPVSLDGAFLFIQAIGR
jgi:hypothetical protein